MTIYVINLEKDQERKAFQEKQLQALKLTYKITPAVTINDISKETYSTHQNDWQRPLRKVEIACYYSHQHLWQKIVQDNTPALILEDDALLSKHLPQILTYLDKLTHIDYINLEVVGRKKIVAKEREEIPCCDTHLHKLYLDRNGTGGYILYPSGAKKLLTLENKIGIGLADAHINACRDLITYQIEPAVVIQLDQCMHYGITPPLKAVSNIGTQVKPKSETSNRLLFVGRRLSSQLQQGIQHLVHITDATKREINIRSQDFFLTNTKRITDE